MIGSLMSRLGNAEKLSITQLQKAIQDGTLPAFVGVPLLQEKVKLAQSVQMAQAASHTQPQTVADQVMAQAQGIEQAQSNLPQTYADGGILNFQPQNTDDSEHEYAGGGMIAFANRGIVDEDDDVEDADDYEDRKEAEEQHDLDAELAQMNALKDFWGESQGIAGSPVARGITTESKVNLTPQAAKGFALNKDFGIQANAPTGTGIREEARAPSGIEALEARVLRQESGGRRYDKEGKLLTSHKGAEGEMQVMPATQRDPGFGVKPARDNSPEEKARVGRDYLRALYNYYGGDEQLTLMAYNWGPGNVNKWLKSGKDVAMVPRETRQYASLAKGGIASLPTRHFFTGDPVEDIIPEERITRSDRPITVDSQGIASLDEDDIQSVKARAAKNRADKPTSVSGKSNAKAGINSLMGPNAGPQLPRGTARLGASSEANIYPGASDLNYYNELKALSEKDPSYEPYKEEMAKLLKRNPDLLKQTSTTPVNLMGPLATTAKQPGTTATPIAGMSEKDVADEIERLKNKGNPAAAQSDEAFMGGRDSNPQAPAVRGASDQVQVNPMGDVWGNNPFYKEMYQDYQRSRENIAKQKDQDTYLSILAAGLGMLGGTSPHAGVNIGQGALSGIQTALASAKQRVRQEGALNAMLARLGAAHETATARTSNKEAANRIKFSEDTAKVKESIAKEINQIIEKQYFNLPTQIQTIDRRISKANVEGKKPDPKDIAERDRLAKIMAGIEEKVRKGKSLPNPADYGIKNAPIVLD